MRNEPELCKIAVVGLILILLTVDFVAACRVGTARRSPQGVGLIATKASTHTSGSVFRLAINEGRGRK